MIDNMCDLESIGNKKVELEMKKKMNVTLKRYKIDINKVDFDNCKLNESINVDWFSPPVDGSSHSFKWCLRLFPKGVDDHEASAAKLGPRNPMHTLAERVVAILYSPVNKNQVLDVKFGSSITSIGFMANDELFPESYSNIVAKLIEKSRNGELKSEPKESEYNFRKLQSTSIEKIPFHENKTTLLIDIVMVMVEKDIVESEQTFPQNSNLLNDLKTISELEEFHDFTIICGGEKISCHKTILAARSDIMKAMLVGDTLERQENKVIIEDSTPKLVKFLVKHLYDGDIPENINELAVDLIYLAVKYQVYDLIKACQEALIENLTDENAIATLIIVDRYVPQSNMRAKVLEFITNHAAKVVKSKDMAKFIQMYPVLVMNLFSSMAEKLEPVGKV